jgi:hypothetical protein
MNDLAPSDFHLFLHLKKFLAGQRFKNDEDVKRAVQKWLVFTGGYVLRRGNTEIGIPLR